MFTGVYRVIKGFFLQCLQGKPCNIYRLQGNPCRYCKSPTPNMIFKGHTAAYFIAILIKGSRFDTTVPGPMM